MLRAGARITVALPQLAATDAALRGTQKLLLEEGRNALSHHYKNALQLSAAITTTVNTSVSFLQEADIFSDTSRENDITYYVVGKGMKTDDFAFEVQEKRFSNLHVPRVLVSQGERLQFAGLLQKLAVRSAKRAAAEAPPTELSTTGRPLVGASVFLNREDREDTMNQLVAASTEKPDFFAIGSCNTAVDVAQVLSILAETRPTMKVLEHRNLTGHAVKDREETELGFDIPVLLLPDSEAGLEGIAEVVSMNQAAFSCVGAPLGFDDEDRLRAALSGVALAVHDSTGTSSDAGVQLRILDRP